MKPHVIMHTMFACFNPMGIRYKHKDAALIDSRKMRYLYVIVRLFSILNHLGEMQLCVYLGTHNLIIRTLNIQFWSFKQFIMLFITLSFKMFLECIIKKLIECRYIHRLLPSTVDTIG